jgi:hypothetical protein
VCTKKVKSSKEKVDAIRKKSLLNSPWKINEQAARRKINYLMSHIIVSLKTIQPSSSCQPTNFQTLQALGSGQRQEKDGSPRGFNQKRCMVCTDGLRRLLQLNDTQTQAVRALLK